MARHPKSAARRLGINRLGVTNAPLRQLQKLVARAATPLDHEMVEYLKILLGDDAPPAVALARLVARYGPDATLGSLPPKAEARPKDTDEVAPATAQQDGALHGGDGASGEVDHPARAKYRSLRVAPSTSSGSRAFAALGDNAPDPLEVKRVQRALAHLVGAGQSEASPRWDSSKLVKRVVARRPLWPARREEFGRPSILVLPDVSGSCAPIAEQSLRLARAAAALGVPGADVIIVSHVNGEPRETQVNNAAPRYTRYDSSQAIGYYRRLTLKYHVTAVLAVGDGQGEWVYRELASHPAINRLVWLDNTRCRVLPAPRRVELMGWPKAARAKAICLEACPAEDFAGCLELALSKT